mgnify:CR=1 FL=1
MQNLSKTYGAGETSVAALDDVTVGSQVELVVEPLYADEARTRAAVEPTGATYKFIQAR